MAQPDKPRPLSLYGPQRAGELFAEYCAGERERRLNSGQPFDAALFDEAVDLVLRRLQALEQADTP